MESGIEYGIAWTKEECDAADFIAMAYENKCTTSVPAIRRFIRQEKGKILHSQLIQVVILKMDSTHERLLKEQPPYLKDGEYNRLVDYQKPRKATRQTPTNQKAIKVTM